jgi:ribosomal protein S12
MPVHASLCLKETRELGKTEQMPEVKEAPEARGLGVAVITGELKGCILHWE